MARLKYVGPLDAVEVPLVDGSWVVVENGKVGEFEDAVAASLAEQINNWQPEASKPAAAKPETKTGKEGGN
jgi:hypothetical protein